LLAGSFILNLATVHLQQMTSQPYGSPDAGHIGRWRETTGEGRKLGDLMLMDCVVTSLMELAL
jgi:hypothetical protein